MSKPIPSTTGVYKPGVGVTITKANIDRVQERRLKAHMDPLTSGEVCDELMKLNSCPAGACIKPRHLHRAALLM